MKLKDVMQALDDLGDEIRAMRTITRCRYLDRNRVQCSAEAVDDEADVLLCIHHLGQAMALLRTRGVR